MPAKKSLLTWALVSVILLACTYIETAIVSYPSLGSIQAELDHKLGVQKYFFYGYVDSDISDLMTEKLRQKNIKAVFRGCEIGGTNYDYEMAYNKTVRRHLSVNDLKYLRRKKEADL
jgi:hypothetical protein